MRRMQSESRTVEAGPEAVREWTSEGGLNGRPSRCRRDPTRYPSGAYDGTRSERTSWTSIWVVSQKLALLSQKGGKSVFLYPGTKRFQTLAAGNGPSIAHPNQYF